MTYNFDPERWYDNEYAFLSRKRRLGEISEKEYAGQLKHLEKRLEEMWARVDGTYCIDEGEMLQIEVFDIKNYDHVYALWRQCEGIGLSVSDEKENIRQYLKKNPGMSFVATANGKVAGAVLCGHDGRRGYLHHLAVHPDCRGKGIGRRLVDRCLFALKKAGIHKCHLFSLCGNTDGERFWRAIGWRTRSDLDVFSREIG